MLAPRLISLFALAATCLACQAAATPLAVASGVRPSGSLPVADDSLPPARSAVQVRVGDSSNALKRVRWQVGTAGCRAAAGRCGHRS